MARDRLRTKFPQSEPIPLRPPSPPISPLNRSDSKYTQSYAITNLQFNEDSRTTVAVVGQEGKTGVDYTVIQEAIDYADSLGGGNVLIKAGTYRPDKFITLKDNVYLIGENPERTIIDFSSTKLADNQSGLFATGSNIYNLPSGTVAFTSGSRTITASTATFLQAKIQAGDTIFIAFIPLVVKSVDSDTQITLTEVWEGPTGTSDALSVLRPKRNIFIKNMTLKDDGGGTGHGALLFTWCDKVGAERVVAEKFSGRAIVIESCFNFLIKECEAKYSLTGFQVHNQLSGDIVNSGQIINCISWNNSSRGFNVEDNSQVAITGCKAVNNNIGFRSSANNTIISNCYAWINNIDGIRIDSANFCVISNNTVRANVDGIVTAFISSSPDNNIIANNTLFENSSDAIFMEGDETTIIGNTCELPVNGTGIDLAANADDNTIIGNILDGDNQSGTIGIELDSGADDNFLSGNKFIRIATQTSDSGTNTVRASRFVPVTDAVQVVSTNPGNTDWIPVDVTSSTSATTYAVNLSTFLSVVNANRELFLRKTGSSLGQSDKTRVAKTPSILSAFNITHPTVETNTSQSFDWSVDNGDVTSVVIHLRGYSEYTD